MRALEVTIAHGYLSATVKDYATKRAREHAPRPASTGKANLSGWEKLAAMWKGPMQRGGDRFVEAVT